MDRCPNCGQPNEPEARFCGECGHDLASVARSAEDDASEVKSRSWLLIGGGLGLTVLCGLCLVILVIPRLVGDLDFDQLLSDPNPPAIIEPVEPADPVTGIYEVQLEHNVPFEGNNYMVVHIEFEIEQVQAQRVSVVTRVWHQDGSPMEASDPAYSVAGQAGLLDFAEVEYSPSTYWQDYQLWLPYDAILVGEDHYVTVVLEETGGGTVLDAWRTEPFYVE